mmetsp:Transcript_15990/g.37978  ORF Transcript_15990/g.37978 Transcript_15990/m.37978 type:complete len:210 (+) Transcript_15990:628-1257(+)
MAMSRSQRPRLLQSLFSARTGVPSRRIPLASGSQLRPQPRSSNPGYALNWTAFGASFGEKVPSQCRKHWKSCWASRFSQGLERQRPWRPARSHHQRTPSSPKLRKCPTLVHQMRMFAVLWNRARHRLPSLGRLLPATQMWVASPWYLWGTCRHRRCWLRQGAPQAKLTLWLSTSSFRSSAVQVARISSPTSRSVGPSRAVAKVARPAVL